jgi:hypothetical protein
MRKFLNQLFSEAGTASFSRVGTSLALFCSCAWISTIVWRTSALPSLDGVTFFIASLYGLGKAGETVQRVLNRTADGPRCAAKPEAQE